MGDVLRSDDATGDVHDRGGGAAADRADRDPQRPGDPGGVPALRRRGSRPAHPRHLGGLGVPGPGPADDLGRRAPTLEGNAFERLARSTTTTWTSASTGPPPDAVEWTALTTGGFGGFDAWLADAHAGTLAIDTALVKAEIPVADIGPEDIVHDAGGIRRRVRVFRMPDDNPHTCVRLERRIALRRGVDNALYVNIVCEDGHQIWSSPIYVFDGAAS